MTFNFVLCKMIYFRSLNFVFVYLCLGALIVDHAYCSGSTDSSTIRAIESEVRRMKTTSDNIFAEVKKQKDTTTALQNEFKWLHNEIKGLKKSIGDFELLVNQTVRNDTEYIREKITDLNNFIFKIGKVNSNTPAPIKTANSTSSSNATSTTTTTTPATKKFKLF